MGFPVAAVAAAGMGLFNGENDRRQLRQQEKMNVLNNEHAKQMGLFNYDLQKRMWDETNYEAQIAHMKKAGMNPAYLYGMSGGGGTTTGSASGSHQGGQVQQTDQVGMGIQNAMQTASLELVKAQANKANAEAENLRGVERENVAADTENKQWQSKLQKLAENFTSQTYFAAVKKLEYETNIQLQIMQREQNATFIDDNTVGERMQKIIDEAAGVAINNSVMNANKKLTEEQTNKVIGEIKNAIRALEQKDVELAQGKRRLDQEDKYIIIDEVRNKLIETGIWVNGASQVIGNVVDLLKPKGFKGTVTEKFTNGPKGSSHTVTETRPIKN